MKTALAANRRLSKCSAILAIKMAAIEISENRNENEASKAMAMAWRK